MPPREHSPDSARQAAVSPPSVHGPGSGGAILSVVLGPRRFIRETRAAARDRALARGALFASGAFSDPPRHPYGAFAEAILPLLDRLRFERLPAEDAALARWALETWLSGRSGSQPTHAPAALPAPDGAVRFRRWVRDLVGEVAPDEPLVLWLEDCQRSDPESLELLERLLAERCDRGRTGSGGNSGGEIELVVAIDDSAPEEDERARARRVERRLKKVVRGERIEFLRPSTRFETEPAEREAPERFLETREPLERRQIQALAASATAPLELAVVDLLFRRVARERGSEWSSERTRELVLELCARDWLELVDPSAHAELRWTSTEIPSALRLQLAEDTARFDHAILVDALVEYAGSADADAVASRVALHARLGRRPDLLERAASRFAERCAEVHAFSIAAALFEELFDLEMGGAEDEAGGAGTHRSLAETQAGRLGIARRLVEIYRAIGRDQSALRKLAFIASEAERRQDLAATAAAWRELGEVYRALEETASAAHFLERSLDVLRNLRSPGRLLDRRPLSATERDEYTRSLLALGSFRLAQGDLRTARELVQEAIDLLAPADHDARTRARAEGLEAEILDREGHFDAAVDARRRALETSEASGDLAELFTALDALGLALLRKKSLDEAESHFERGRDLAREARACVIEARFLARLGACRLEGGDVAEALTALRESGRLQDAKIGAREAAETLRLLGVAQLAAGEIALAIDSLERSVEGFVRAGEEARSTDALVGLARALRFAGRGEAASEYVYRALERQQARRDRQGACESCLELASVYLDRGDVGRAITFARRATRLAERTRDGSRLARARIRLAEGRAREGRFAEALRITELCVGDASGDRSAESSRAAARVRASVLRRIGRTDEALAALQAAAPEGSKEVPLNDQEESFAFELERARVLAASDEPRRALELLEESSADLDRIPLRLRLEHALERCAVQITTGDDSRARVLLDELYRELEKLHVRDLVPWYFLLVARLERSSDPENARRSFERALAEARNSASVEAEWLALRERAKFEETQGKGTADGAIRRLRDEAARALDRLTAEFSDEERAAWMDRERASGHPVPPPREANPPGIRGDPRARGLGVIPGAEAAAERAARVAASLLSIHDEIAQDREDADRDEVWRALARSASEIFAAERVTIVGVGEDGSLRIVGTPTSRGAEIAGRDGEEPALQAARAALATSEPVSLPHPDNGGTILAQRIGLGSETNGALVLECDSASERRIRSESALLATFSRHATLAAKKSAEDEAEKRRRDDIESRREDNGLRVIKLRQKLHKQSVQLAIADADLRHHRELLEAEYSFDRIIGRSPALRRTVALLERLSSSAIPVLLWGESGTGKELIARAIHFNGPRRNRRFVSENCGALTPALVDSEWFGHERGAFTGAFRDREGLLVAADGGTLFLDGVEAMHLSVQTKLLRFLQTGELRPVGARETLRADVRVIAATTVDLQRLVAEGKFRDDLFYRLNGIAVRLPALRERREDIPLLVEHFCRAIAAREDRPRRIFSPEALQKLAGYPWPGNVRELRNLVEKVHVVSEDLTIGPETVTFESVDERAPEPPPVLESFRDARRNFEREYVDAILRSCDGNVSQAADRSGLSRESLYRLIRKHGLKLR